MRGRRNRGSATFSASSLPIKNLPRGLPQLIESPEPKLLDFSAENASWRPDTNIIYVRGCDSRAPLPPAGDRGDRPAFVPQRDQNEPLPDREGSAPGHPAHGRSATCVRRRFSGKLLAFPPRWCRCAREAFSATTFSPGYRLSFASGPRRASSAISVL
jgi:hypothetical protein